jgi:glutamate dehydrogenase/leucine dehydrogenase
VRIHNFSSTDAFVAIDLDNAEASSGPVRWARKILQGGATDLARSQTYTYAVLGMQRGGASAGINAEWADREAAVAAFATEAATLVADGTYLPDAAKGVEESDLTPLRGADPRDTARLTGDGPTFVDRCEGLGAAVSAEQSIGGLDGKTVAIEGFGTTGAAIAAAVVERGGLITSIATSTGTITDPSGFDASALADAWVANGDDMVNDLGDVGHPMSIFGSTADVWFVGSKMGVVNHEVAAQIGEAAAVLASDRVPITARALAVFRRAGVAVPADFVSLAGSTLALWGDANRTEAEILAGVIEDIRDLTTEFATHEDGPFLAACFQAESFLSGWQESLPFGRPLAP